MAEASEAPATPTTPKVKTRQPFQRACNEKDAKGKLCAGHLKRYYKKQDGEQVEIYRCEYCHTLYLPAPGHQGRTGTLQF